jgi:alcohol dehydrogenase class IV
MQEAAYLAGTAIDRCGTGMAHAIGHALGSLYHLPHGVAVAIGLEAALGWNVEGGREASGAVAAALDVDVDGLVSCYRSLWTGSGLPAPVASLSDLNLDASAIASTMVTEENLPMVRNNCRPSTAQDVRDLAERTVAVWAGLRATAGAAR